jgi:hypothetical protein
MPNNKRRGIIVSSKFVKPAGLNIFVPAGSSAIKKAQIMMKKKAKARIEETKQKEAQAIQHRRGNPSEIERELITLLNGKEVEVKGRYKMDRFILRSDGHKLTILYKGRKSGELKPVKDLDKLSLALYNAATALRL